jgi:DNA invertase Pin-like site-specific DNA recombinase
VAAASRPASRSSASAVAHRRPVGVTLAQEFQALGVDRVVLDQAIDTTTPSGRLVFHVLAAIAEFERELIRERVCAGFQRARAQGQRLGRPRLHYVDPGRARGLLAEGCRSARSPGVSRRTMKRSAGLSQIP